MINLQFEQLVKSYAGKKTLRVNLQIAEGEIMHLYGISGSGKTTLLNIIAGFKNPAGGLIQVAGKVWFDSKQGINLAVNQRKAGFVFQNYALFQHMTVVEHLKYACKEIALIERLIHMAALESFKNHLPSTLSAGQQQRLGIIRALSTCPPLLLMDEPFSALDDESKALLLTNLKEFLNEYHTTAIIASHNHSEMKGLATNYLNMNDCLY